MHRSWWRRLPLFAPDGEGQQGAQGQQAAQQQSGQQGQQQGAQGAQGLGDVAARQAAEAAAAAAAAQGAQGQGQQQQSDPLAGKYVLKERPAWLPESFHDPKTGEVRVEALAQNAADLKAKLSTGTHKPPATADGYALDFSKETDADIKASAAAFIVPGEDGSPDPIMKAIQEDAFKEGVSTHAFNVIARSFLKHQAQLIPPPFDERAEMAKLGQNGPALLKGLNDYADEQVKRGFWDDADLQRWKNWNYDAGDAQLLYKLLFDSGRVPEIKTQAMTTAAATPDAATLDAEVHQLMDQKAQGKLTDAQFQAAMDANTAKRAKLYGKDPTRSWPPAA